MDINYKDFIGVYSEVFPKGFCEHIIKEVEFAYSQGAGFTRQQMEGIPSHLKQDTALLGTNLKFRDFNNTSVADIYFDGLQKCFDNYYDKYSILKDFKLKTTDFKIQRTNPGEGYHVWHSEHGPGYDFSGRVLTFIFYLNTLKPENNGDTEFLYQQRKIQPIENTLVIWPAGFTHPHRGNPVYGNASKYIITGWFNFV